MTLRGPSSRHDATAAERLHRALLVHDSICSDPETQALVETTRLLAPAPMLAMSAAGRAEGQVRMLAAARKARAAHQTASLPKEPVKEVDHAPSLRSTAHVVDTTGDLGMVMLSDVESIDADRARLAMQEISALLARQRLAGR